MAQTATLLATGNIEGELPSDLDEGKVEATPEIDSGDPGPSALISGILDALDIVDPPAPAPKQDKVESVDLAEWETEVMANMDLKNPAGQDEASTPPASKVVDPGPDLDDEIEFID